MSYYVYEKRTENNFYVENWVPLDPPSFTYE